MSAWFPSVEKRVGSEMRCVTILRVSNPSYRAGIVMTNESRRSAQVPIPVA